MCFVSIYSSRVCQSAGSYVSVSAVVMDVSCVLFLFHESSLSSLHLSGRLPTTRLPAVSSSAPSPSLLPTPAPDTASALSPPPPVEKTFSPAQLAPSSPWGMGQLKTGQELSGAVMPCLRLGLAPVFLQSVSIGAQRK